MAGRRVMKYILLVAGKGSRLHPLTLKHLKSMFKLDENTNLVQRMVSLIKESDQNAEIIAVTGHMHRCIEKSLDDVEFIYNPFYEVTNSIASLWMAKKHLDSDNIVLIDGDIVMSRKLVKEVVCYPVTKATVLLDSSIRANGDYNVEVSEEKVLVMSKELKTYYGEYAGVTKLDRESALLLKDEIELMVEEGYYDQWYENALVQMIFKNNFELYYNDISSYEWTEVDEVNDLIVAKNIHLKEKGHNY